MLTTSKPKLYNPPHPERTLHYQTVAEHHETWLELASEGQIDGQGDHHSPKPYVRKAFAKFLECGIFAHGFARARCDDCGRRYQALRHPQACRRAQRKSRHAHRVERNQTRPLSPQPAIHLHLCEEGKGGAGRAGTLISCRLRTWYISSYCLSSLRTPIYFWMN